MGVLNLYITFILFIGISYLFYKFLKYSSLESLFISLSSIVITLIIGAKCDKLFLVTNISFLIGAIGVFLFFIDLYKSENKKKFILNFFSPGIVAICAIFILLSITHYGMLIHNWDELTTWGRMSRFLFDTGLNPTLKRWGDYPYPFAVPIWSYFFTKLGNKFVESNLYIASFLFWFIPIMLPFYKTKWDNAKKCFIYAAVIYFSISFISFYPYFSLYVDIPLGAFTGGISAWWLFSDKKLNVKNIFFILIPLLAIANMDRISALFFAFCAALFIFLIYIFDNRNFINIKSIKTYLSSQKKSKLFFILGILIIIISASAFIIYDATRHIFSSNGLIVIKTILSKPVLIAGTKVFLMRGMLVPGIFPASYFSLLCVLLAVSIVTYIFIKDKDFKKLYKFAIILFFVGAISYHLIMVVQYFFDFAYEKAITFPSIGRFYSSFIILGAPVVFCPLFALKDKKEDSRLIMQLCIALLILSAIFAGPDFFTYATAFNKDDINLSVNYKIIVKMRKEAAYVKNIIGDNKKIYLISQGTARFDDMIASVRSVDLLPAATYQLGAALPPKHSIAYGFDADGTYTKKNGDKLYISDFKNTLINENFDYIWIHNSNNYLKQIFSTKEFFGIDENDYASGGLYKIIKDGGNIKLEYIDNSKKGLDFTDTQLEAFPLFK